MRMNLHVGPARAHRPQMRKDISPDRSTHDHIAHHVGGLCVQHRRMLYSRNVGEGSETTAGADHDPRDSATQPDASKCSLEGATTVVICPDRPPLSPTLV